MPELRLVAEETRGAGDVLAAWLPRVAVALIFLSVGWEKFSEHGPWIRIFARIGLGDWFRYFTGTMQVGGALLLFVPRLVRLGAAVLACTMIGAIVTNIFILNSGLSAIIPSALLAAIVFVGLSAR
ncbi:MAG TPA: DoxX family protein [Vicinamibacterales bacterium]|nr:DoxX family protein [Vicinamibacterales bacterium]